MNDEELVGRATKVLLGKLAEGKPASPDALEAAAAAVDRALDREIVGLAVLRLLRDGKIRLTEDYQFESPKAEALSA